jgi:predicted ArsR family transcriptional regulator
MAYLTTAKKTSIANSAAVRTTSKDTVKEVLDEVAAAIAAHKAAAVPDLAGGADLATTVSKVNAILAALRAAGLMDAS